MPQPRQPFLHDLVTVLAAPTQVHSDRFGNVRSSPEAASAQGVIHADVRVVSRVELSVDGVQPAHLATELTGGAALFTYLLGNNSTTGDADPQVRLDRCREVAPGAVAETLTISSLLPKEMHTTVRLEVGTDLAAMGTIKVGDPAPPRPFPAVVGERVAWGSEVSQVEFHAPEATLRLADDDRTLVCTWPVVVPAGGARTLRWLVLIFDTGAAVVAATAADLDPGGVTAPLVKAVARRRGVDARRSPGWSSPWPTSTGCGWRCPTRPRTPSTRPGHRSISPCSVGTASGRPG